MKSSIFLSALSALAGFNLVAGRMPIAPKLEPMKVNELELAELLDPAKPLVGNGTFEQYIDHTNPSLGTFKQSYWYNATTWKGPGSPVVLMTPGEIAAAGYTGYLTDRTITGQYAKVLGGAVIVIEHRYWGPSTPFAVQSTKNLQYHTLDQAIADFTRFAREIELPFDTKHSSNAPQAPWVFVGGSYPGALAGWIASLEPGTFWAYHASSAVVEAVYDYWQYFTPMQQGMPKNCSKDLSRVVDYMDTTLTVGTPKQQKDFKAMFGLQDLKHNDDVASAIAWVVGPWQSIQLNAGPGGSFFQMCDAVEGITANSTGKTPGPDGVGLQRALPNLAAYFKNQFLPNNCAGYGYSDWSDPLSVACFDTYNKSSPIFTDWSADNAADRPWVWMTCNEPFAYWQTGAPLGIPSIMSRLVNTQYYQRQCDLYFPQEGPYTYGSKRGKTVEQLNARTKGWFFTNTKRLLWVNGEFDPWRSASVASDFRPGGPLKSRPGAPSFVIPGARHCNELNFRNSVNQGVNQTQIATTKQIVEWVNEFYTEKNVQRGWQAPKVDDLKLEVQSEDIV